MVTPKKKEQQDFFVSAKNESPSRKKRAAVCARGLAVQTMLTVGLS